MKFWFWNMRFKKYILEAENKNCWFCCKRWMLWKIRNIKQRRKPGPALEVLKAARRQELPALLHRHLCGLKCSTIKSSQWDSQQPQHQHETATTSFPMRSPISNTQKQPASKKVTVHDHQRSYQQESRKTMTSHPTVACYSNQAHTHKQTPGKSSRCKEKAAVK